jgi:hypothetical protein
MLFRFTLSLPVLLSFSSNLFSQNFEWEVIETNTFKNIYEIEDLGSSGFVFVGDSGLVGHKMNGSTEWILKSAPTSNAIISAEQIRYNNTGWRNKLSTANCEVFSLTEAGEIVADSLPQYPPEQLKNGRIKNLNIANNGDLRYGMACDSGRIFCHKSPWPTPRFDILFPTQKPINDIYPFNTWQILALGDSGKMWRTSGLNDPFLKINHGLTSKKLNVGFGKGDSKVFVAGDSGTCLYSTNNAQTWAKLEIPTTQNLKAGLFFDTIIVVGGENGFLANSVNEGQSWTVASTGVLNDINDIKALGNEIYAAGNRGLLLKLNLVSTTKSKLKKLEIDWVQKGNRIEINNTHLDLESVKVTSLDGRCIFDSITRNSKEEIRLPKPGVFMLTFQLKSGQNVHQKIFISN